MLARIFKIKLRAAQVLMKYTKNHFRDGFLAHTLFHARAEKCDGKIEINMRSCNFGWCLCVWGYFRSYCNVGVWKCTGEFGLHAGFCNFVKWVVVVECCDYFEFFRWVFNVNDEKFNIFRRFYWKKIVFGCLKISFDRHDVFY